MADAKFNIDLGNRDKLYAQEMKRAAHAQQAVQALRQRLANKKVGE